MFLLSRKSVPEIPFKKKISVFCCYCNTLLTGMYIKGLDSGKDGHKTFLTDKLTYQFNRTFGRKIWIRKAQLPGVKTNNVYTNLFV